MDQASIDQQQEVVQNFFWLLNNDFTEADRLIESDENFDHINTFNACYTLYQEHLKNRN